MATVLNPVGAKAELATGRRQAQNPKESTGGILQASLLDGLNGEGLIELIKASGSLNSLAIGV